MDKEKEQLTDFSKLNKELTAGMSAVFSGLIAMDAVVDGMMLNLHSNDVDPELLNSLVMQFGMGLTAAVGFGTIAYKIMTNHMQGEVRNLHS